MSSGHCREDKQQRLDKQARASCLKQDPSIHTLWLEMNLWMRLPLVLSWPAYPGLSALLQLSLTRITTDASSVVYNTSIRCGMSAKVPVH